MAKKKKKKFGENLTERTLHIHLVYKVIFIGCFTAQSFGKGFIIDLFIYVLMAKLEKNTRRLHFGF